MNDANDTSNTALDALSREVPDSAIGPERTEEEAKAHRLSLVHRSISLLVGFHEKLEMVERALSAVLPETLKEQALGDAVDLISDLSTAYNKIGGDGGSLAALGKRLTFAKEVTMPEILDEAKVKTFNTDKYRVTKTSKVYASVVPESGIHTEGEFAGQPKAWDWLRANGYEMLIKPTVNASSLSAAAKELLENGSELPDDLFKVSPRTSISITKKK